MASLKFCFLVLAVVVSVVQLGRCESDIPFDAFMLDAAIIPRGSSSNLDNQFEIVSNQSLVERQLTCPSGYGLCPNSNLCAQLGGRCCDDLRHTCRAGYLCCGSGCVATDDYCCPNIVNTDYHGCDGATGACCGSQCMHKGSTCCPNVSNNDRHGCLAGYNCCGDNCSPTDGQCCKTGKYCPQGTWCVLYQGVQKCCNGLLCLGEYNPSYVLVPPRPTGATVIPGAVPNTNVQQVSTPDASSPGGAVTSVTPTAYPTPASTPSASSPTAGYYTFTVTLSDAVFVYTGSGSNYQYSGLSTVYQTSTVSFYATGVTAASFSALAWSFSHYTLISTSIQVAGAAAVTSSSRAFAATAATATGASGASGGLSAGSSTTVGVAAGVMIAISILSAALMVVL